MLVMVSQGQSDNFNLLIGQNKVFLNPGKGSSILLAKYIKQKSNLDKKGQ